jgi:hypothetical protein
MPISNEEAYTKIEFRGFMGRCLRKAWAESRPSAAAEFRIWRDGTGYLRCEAI